MAKGMNKRKEVKKPKKEAAKPGSTVAAAGGKNAVQTSTIKAKE
jgi:hypothetical protein